MRFPLAGLRRRAALLLIALAPLAQAAACPPGPPSAAEVIRHAPAAQSRDRGLLWRLEKDGRVSWLYGTLHVNRPEWAVPGPRVRAAVLSSAVLALELDPADPGLVPALLAATDVARNQRVLAGHEAEMARLAEQACMPVAGLARMPVVLQLTTLGLAEARRQGLHPEVGVDTVLLNMATRLGKRFVSLETAEQQIAALTGLDEADERELVADGLQEMAGGAAREVAQRLAQAWADGDEATLADYPAWCRCEDTPAERRFTRRLNDARNPAIADRLAALHAAGDSFFAGVGVLHMTGAQGLPGLLRARGFDVRRVPFSSTP